MKLILDNGQVLDLISMNDTVFQISETIGPRIKGMVGEVRLGYNCPTAHIPTTVYPGIHIGGQWYAYKLIDNE